jgi:hypothetical protein
MPFKQKKKKDYKTVFLVFFLPQISFKDGSTPDLAATRSLTGPDILQKHSINSLLERNEMINRGLSSPIEGE